MCRLALYALFLLFQLSFFSCLIFVRAREVNFTVDDADPSIVYQPNTAWFFNGNSSSCTFCLTPTIAYNSTWHQGLYVISTDDPSVDNDGATTSPFVADGNDPDPLDFPVSVQLNFTGSAIYLFCILPLGVPPNVNSTPTLMNLSFTLDGEPAGSFFHNGSINTGGFQSNVPVLSLGNLSNSAHNILVDLGPNSVFLFDYYVFSQSNGSNTGSPGTISESSAARKKHDVRTFAGAVGGSVGVLAVVSTCVALSIYRRRRRSTEQQDRERQSDAQSFHTDVSEDSPSMQGPSPFIPRYFPGTVPLAPPPYIGPAGPPIPPVAVHDTEPLDIPPPFSVAVSFPEPPVLVDAMRQARPRISPPSFVEDGQSALPEVSHLPLTESAVLPPRSAQPFQSTHLPDSLSDTPSISPTHSATGSEAEAPLSRVSSDRGIALET